MQMERTGCPETSVTDYRSALSNIGEERRSGTYRPIKPEHISSANNMCINIQPVKCRIHILKQAPGNVTQLSNRKLTKRITKPNELLYTAEGRAVWLSLQNTCIVPHSLYAVWLSLQNTCIVTNSLYDVCLSLQNTCIVTHSLYAVWLSL